MYSFINQKKYIDDLAEARKRMKKQVDVEVEKMNRPGPRQGRLLTIPEELNLRSNVMPTGPRISPYWSNKAQETRASLVKGRKTIKQLSEAQIHGDFERINELKKQYEPLTSKLSSIEDKINDFTPIKTTLSSIDSRLKDSSKQDSMIALSNQKNLKKNFDNLEKLFRDQTHLIYNSGLISQNQNNDLLQKLDELKASFSINNTNTQNQVDLLGELVKGNEELKNILETQGIQPIKKKKSEEDIEDLLNQSDIQIQRGDLNEGFPSGSDVWDPNDLINTPGSSRFSTPSVTPTVTPRRGLTQPSSSFIQQFPSFDQSFAQGNTDEENQFAVPIQIEQTSTQIQKAKAITQNDPGNLPVVIPIEENLIKNPYELEQTPMSGIYNLGDSQVSLNNNGYISVLKNGKPVPDLTWNLTPGILELLQTKSEDYNLGFTNVFRSDEIAVKKIFQAVGLDKNINSYKQKYILDVQSGSPSPSKQIGKPMMNLSVQDVGSKIGNGNVVIEPGKGIFAYNSQGKLKNFPYSENVKNIIQSIGASKKAFNAAKSVFNITKAERAEAIEILKWVEMNTNTETRRFNELMTGSGIKLRNSNLKISNNLQPSMNKSCQPTIPIYYSNLQELQKRLMILVGSFEAGNHSKFLINEVMNIIDILLKNNIISKDQHNQIFDLISH